MSEINLEEARIKFQDKWHSIDDLTRTIQDRIESGDMKIAGLAAALEELKNAIDSAFTLNVKFIIDRDEYDALKRRGGDDDVECVRKAIRAYIGQNEASSAGPPVAPLPKAEPATEPKRQTGGTTIIKCAKCRASIEIPTDDMPSEIKCTQCGARGQLKIKA
jgi:DNA-directed RNA polymerase subunit RPC12/RpoP